MGKPLTSELVLLRSKCDNLFSVKNLNLWGNEIDDVKLLRQMPNVEVLSLSLNKISNLKEFASCPKLQELYLRRNNVTDISEVRYLSHLQNLKILWLLDNPCSEIENYRDIVIKLLPNLTKLDNTQITSEERSNAAKRTFNFMEDEQESENKGKQGLPLSEKRGSTNEYNSSKVIISKYFKKKLNCSVVSTAKCRSTHRFQKRKRQQSFERRIKRIQGISRKSEPHSNFISKK